MLRHMYIRGGKERREKRKQSRDREREQREDTREGREKRHERREGRAEKRARERRETRKGRREKGKACCHRNGKTPARGLELDLNLTTRPRTRAKDTKRFPSWAAALKVLSKAEE